MAQHPTTTPTSSSLSLSTSTRSVYGTTSNYNTDLFQPLFEHIHTVSLWHNIQLQHRPLPATLWAHPHGEFMAQHPTTTLTSSCLSLSTSTRWVDGITSNYNTDLFQPLFEHIHMVSLWHNIQLQHRPLPASLWAHPHSEFMAQHPTTTPTSSSLSLSTSTRWVYGITSNYNTDLFQPSLWAHPHGEFMAQHPTTTPTSSSLSLSTSTQWVYGTTSNYNTDLFLPLFEHIHTVSLWHNIQLQHRPLPATLWAHPHGEFMAQHPTTTPTSSSLSLSTSTGWVYGITSNYNTDLFQPLFEHIHTVSLWHNIQLQHRPLPASLWAHPHGEFMA